MAPTVEEALLGLLLLSHLGTVYLLLDCRGHIPHAAEATRTIGTNLGQMLEDWAEKSEEWTNIVNDIADALDRIDGGIARGNGGGGGTTSDSMGADISPLGLILSLMSGNHGPTPIQERAQEGTVHAEDYETPTSNDSSSTETTPQEGQDQPV